MDYVYIIAGFVLLFVAGEILVRGSVSLAQKLGLSTLLIGVAVIGFGTSAPELVVSLEAALKGEPDIAVGNVVGSNVANLLLILGLVIAITGVRAWPIAAIRDAHVMLLGGLFLLGLAFVGVIVSWVGALMLLTLVGYLIYSYVVERRIAAVSGEAAPLAGGDDGFDEPWSLPVALLAIIGGLVGLVFGADLLVTGAINVARGFGISEAVIGLTLVAVGTSLPELATAVVSALRRQTDVIIGNVIGSNIFNTLCILGATATVTPVPIDPRFSGTDIPVMLGVFLLVTLLLLRRRPLRRWLGLFMLAAYVAYIALLFVAN